MITTKQLKQSEHSWLLFNCTVKYSTRRRSIQLSLDEDNTILVRCPDLTPLSTIKKMICTHHPWLEKQLKKRQSTPTIEHSRFDEDVLLDRVDIWSEQMNLMPKKIRFNQAKTKWGSCNSNKTLTFNRSLLKAPLTIIDYVVIHELAHLKYMNHSKHFWSLVGEFYPDYKFARQWLKTHGHQVISYNLIRNP